MPTEHPVAVWRAPHPAAVLPPDAPGHAALNPCAQALFGDAQTCARFAFALATHCGDAPNVQFDFERWHVRAEVMPPDAAAVRVVWLDIGPIAATGKHATAEQLSLALGLAGVALWRHDMATDQFEWNDHASNLIDAAGHTELPTDLASVRNLIHPDDRAAIIAAHERAVQTTEPISAECRVQCGGAGSEVRHLLSRRVAQRDASGRVTGILGVVVDVTESAEAKLELARLADRLRLATAAAHLGIWDWDLLTNQQVWDEQLRKIYGVGDGWQNTSIEAWYALVHPRDADDALDDMLRSARDGTPYESAFRIIRPDGQVRHLLARGTIYRDDNGQPIRVVGVNWDVTDRRMAERAVTEAMDRLQLATSAAGIGIWEHDVRAGASVWSPQMYTLFGVTDQLGANPQSIWNAALLEEDRPLLAAAKTRAIRRREPYQTEFRIHWPDGSMRWLAARGMVQFDEAGQPLKLIGVNWDITEERQTEEALRAKEAAERASRAKSEFLSRMSHELRTPLNGILGFAQLLASDERKPLLPEQRARLQRIEDAGWHLLALINDLLDLSRIESGSLTLNLENVDLDDAATEVISLLTQSAAESGVEVSLVKRIGRPNCARVDALRMRQVLTNLLSNAIKYNRYGGTVTISAFDPRPGMVGLSVRDSGLGMTQTQLEHLFQPFNRLGRETSEAQGTGIGLVIAKGLVEQMGGTIAVESTAGAGTEFRIELPSAEGPRGVAALPNTAQTVSERRDVSGTVMYIEDNPLNAMVVQEYLSYRPAVRYLHAPDGATGLRMLKDTTPELLLVDMNLPDMSGSEVLEQLRAAGHKPTHCVVLSANVLPHDIARARGEGFDDYWTKPVTISEFLRGIDTLLTH